MSPSAVLRESVFFPITRPAVFLLFLCSILISSLPLLLCHFLSVSFCLLLSSLLFSRPPPAPSSSSFSCCRRLLFLFFLSFFFLCCTSRASKGAERGQLRLDVLEVPLLYFPLRNTMDCFNFAQLWLHSFETSLIKEMDRCLAVFPLMEGAFITVHVCLFYRGL